MTKKQYQLTRIIVAFLIAFTVTLSINLGNYIVPILITIAGFAFMLSARKKFEKSDGIIADERDYKIAGNAARYTLSTYAFLGAISSMVLVVLGKNDPNLMILGYFAAYTTCGLMILNALLFKILINRNEK